MHEAHDFKLKKFIIELQDWYSSPVGEQFCVELQQNIEKLLPELFGYFALQIGYFCNDVDLLQSSKIGHKFHMNLDVNKANVAGSPYQLPFSHDTLDLIVLPHTLDFAQEPHQVLREVHRVLISEGHIVLIAFNPISLMGLSKLAFLRSKRAPWAGHFYTARRLKDWLSLLDFTVTKVEHIGMRPPIQNSHVLKRLEFLNEISGIGLGGFGGVQIFVAKKRVLTLSPRPLAWKPRPRILPVNVAKPSARQANNVTTSRYLH